MSPTSSSARGCFPAERSTTSPEAESRGGDVLKGASIVDVAVVGSGNQGTGLAGLLAREPDVRRIVLADCDQAMIETAMELVGGLDGVDPQRLELVATPLDASDVSAVTAAIQGCDIVFNGTIPAFNMPIMKACLEAGAHYLDLFGLPFEGGGVPMDETIGAQLELDEAYRAKGILGLPSVGMSPGWTSLAADYMMAGMDTVDSVVIRWADWLDTTAFIAPISPGVLFHEWFGAPFPLAVEEGEPTEVDLLDSEEEFDFPQPIGSMPVYTVTAHPDIVLIPLFSDKPIRWVEEKGGIVLGSLKMKDVWLKAIRAQTGQKPPQPEDSAESRFAGSFIAPIEFFNLYESGELKDAALSFTTEVVGTKGGAPIRHTCYYTSTLELAQKHLPWASHSVYGTVGGMPVELVLGLGRGQIKERGVLSVAQLEDTSWLWKAMAARGQMMTEKIDRPIGL
jgi:hypothetical protein